MSNRRLLRVGDGPLEVEIQGQGPDLLLLHGFPFDLRMWDDVVAALSPQARCVRFSARGFGQSSGASGRLSMERIAEDAVAVLDQLQISRAFVAGLSMGGYAAFAFHRRHAERLQGLALIDTRAEPDSPESRANRSALAERVRREGSGPLVEAMLPKLLGKTTLARRPELVSRVESAMRSAAPQAIVDALAGLQSRADSRPMLREIRVPTLVVVGEEDVLTPPADARTLVEGIERARLVTLPESGHLTCYEAPEALARALREFLAARA